MDSPDDPAVPDGIDITPPGSEVPVYLVAADDLALPTLPDPQTIIDGHTAARASAIALLVSLGLPEDQAAAAFGAPPT